MKSDLSLRRAIVLPMVVICCLIVVSYTALLGVFLTRGVDLSIQNRLEVESRKYLDEFAEDPDTVLPYSANLHTYAGYESLPQHIRDSYAAVELDQEQFAISSFGSYYYHIHQMNRPDGKTFYLVHTICREDVSKQTTKDFFKYFFYIPIGVGLLLMAGVILVTLILLRRVAHPVEALNTWAAEVNMDTVDRTGNDFKYAELNQLANLFRKTLRRLGANVAREGRVQKYASHELRTPIAVMLNNLELLEKLGAHEDKRFTASLGRMEKAVKNMRHLTTTLLWGYSRGAISVPDTVIQLEEFVAEIIDDNVHLLTGKETAIVNSLPVVQIEGPATVVRIVLSNIIRNAFQYTYKGEIRLDLRGNTFVVSNDRTPHANADQTECYGLGIELTKQLVKRLGWDLKLVELFDQFIVYLSFSKKPALEESQVSG